jgi:riboflavin-specific deaminase-like protein
MVMATDSQPTRILDLVRGVLSSARERSPVITLSWAQTVNGAIAAKRGEPLAISGRESRIMTHSLRSLHAGILVGIGTVLSDDPLLSVRLVEGPQPRPIILDSRLRTPPGSRVLGRTDAAPWIFHADGSPDRAVLLSARGAALTRVPRAGGGLDLACVCGVLTGGGIGSVMVEGGAEVISSFLQAELFDQVVITVSPSFVSGYAIPPSSARFTRTAWERAGEDVVLWAAR